MRESIERVEATRPARLQETWPMMSPAEKQEILRKFHPDYKPEGMRELRVGPAKGMRTPHELADLLEGHSLLQKRRPGSGADRFRDRRADHRRRRRRLGSGAAGPGSRAPRC